MPLIRATRRFLMVLGAAVAVAGAPAVHGAAIAHWSFDTTQGDKNAYPDSVGGHPATPKQVDQVKPFAGVAPFGNAVMFSTENNQKNSYLTIPPINTMQKTSLTVAAWVYLTKMHANFVITDWKATGDAAWVFGVDLPKAGATIATPIADLRSGDIDPKRPGNHMPVAKYVDQKKNVPLNEWHHLAWTWNRTSGTLTAYMDGEVLGSAKQMHMPLDLTPAKNMVRIGGREANVTGSTGGVNMDGAIDELWIYNEALSQDQIKSVMRYNTMEGTGPLAKVLVKNGDGTVALANPAAPVVEAPRPATPVASGNPRPPRNTGGAVARGNPPKPPTAGTPAAPAAPTVDEHPMDLSGLGGTAVTANADPAPEAPQTTADEDTNPTPLSAIASEVVADSATPIAKVLPRRYTTGRITGMISCATLAVVLGAYLFWALGERAKIRAGR